MGRNSRIIDFSQVYRFDEELVGEKAAEIGELWRLGIPQPNGFVITPDFFREFLRLTDIEQQIYKSPFLKHPALSDSVDNLIQKQIMRVKFPQQLASELHNAYKKLSGIFKDRPLKIFSSPLANKSIIFLNVKGDANYIHKIKKIWSLTFKKPAAIIVSEVIGTKIEGKIVTGNLPNDKNLTKHQTDKLLNYCQAIRNHFYFPKEIDYAVNKDKIFVAGIKPFTGIPHANNKKNTQKNNFRKLLLKGLPLNPGITTGKIRILHGQCRNHKIKKGDIVALSNLDHAMSGQMGNANAIIIDAILPNSLSKALFRKKFHFPAVEGAKNATTTFEDGNIVTVNGMSGEIYSGGLIY